MRLLEALEAGDLERVRALIAAGTDLREEDEHGGCTPLGLAAYFGHVEMIRVLLDAGVPPNHSAHFSVLAGAALEGQVEAACALVEAGASIEGAIEGGMTPLMQAAGVGHLAMVKYLVEAGADMERRHYVSRWEAGRSALDLVVEGGYPEVVAYLLGQGARFEGEGYRDRSGWWPRSPDELVELAERRRVEREARREFDDPAEEESSDRRR